jgi:hypothetical protein
MPFNIKEKVRKKDTYYLEPLFQGFIFRNELGMSVYFSPEEQGQLRSYFNTISPTVINNTLVYGMILNTYSSTTKSGTQYTLLTTTRSLFTTILCDVSFLNNLYMETTSAKFQTTILSTIETCNQLSLCTMTYGILSNKIRRQVMKEIQLKPIKMLK